MLSRRGRKELKGTGQFFIIKHSLYFSLMPYKTKSGSCNIFIIQPKTESNLIARINHYCNSYITINNDNSNSYCMQLFFM